MMTSLERFGGGKLAKAEAFLLDRPRCPGQQGISLRTMGAAGRARCGWSGS